MHICWWCSGELIWKEDVDACEYLFDDEAEGVCTILHCSKCEAVVTYAPPERLD